ncbi:MULTISPECIES: FoF1 ATP synthase subunit gamma [unclassified Caballeronia]|uniref:F0F1 ATP synthase subunit gamma n=1 Tax=unclassified Caballeronia TaxID=2646786 RepID=UPI002855D290|nr:MULTISPECIES: FoF1 ATP synthase subunit gamma [unclassified Caballeronia]MDR5777481.1 F0F1 ATP synthase subunit gamma [Caballeronia sp. LZ002]MDR5798543.1 F0F1 ATP synthase subunit gamma [Caballeronia sp. LZ001]MDR5852899.1 F0F1 ATP synthase subunit gamma [Caballeronia sp. LZ003]
MSNKLGEVEARISSVHELESVVGAMRGIAAARSQEARGRLDGIRACAAMIGSAIGDALMLDDRPAHDGPTPNDGERHVVIVICSEQGFVGAFNEHMIAEAEHVPGREPPDYFVIGGRGAMVAATRGLSVGWSAPMVAHAAEVAALGSRITEVLYGRLEKGLAKRVTLVHAVPQPSAGFDVARTSLLPFDFKRFAAPARRVSPLVTLPPYRLLATLAEEYVYAQLCEALMLSFAAENEARMRAMIAARTHVRDTLDQLTEDFRRLRQEQITAGLVELAAGGSSDGRARLTSRSSR